jgi:Mg-chelatase subunit ChlD
MKKSSDQTSSTNRQDSLESDKTCVEILIRWGASVLASTHLSPPRSFWVGEPREGSPAPDCVIPAEVLGAGRAPIVLAGKDGSVRVVILPGATGTASIAGEPDRSLEELALEACPELPEAQCLPFGRGSRIRMDVRGVSLEIGHVNAGKAVAGHYYVEKRSLPFHGASALIHAGAFAALALLVPPLTEVDDGEVTSDQVYLMQQYLVSASEKEIEEAEEAEQMAATSADKKEGGTGARAKGEEGSAGNPASSRTGSRYGIAGPSESKSQGLSAEEALRDANQFGMVGLLNSGAGGDPNAPAVPWGRSSAAGSSAPGGLDLGIGESVGAAGVGVGGGGKGEGIGLGPIGTIGHGSGAGAGNGPGASGAGRGAPGLSSAPVEAPPAEQPIDPNGRFATTYRPGGGHLAAFESAVSRGIIPAAERELVSDMGARYTPSLDVAPGKGLAIRADLERSQIAPSGGPFHVRIALQGSPEQLSERPRLSVHLVVDVSGSMAGEPIAKAREAALSLVDRLAPTDDFSLVAFSSDAEVKVPDGLVGPRREAIKAVIRELREEGGTNIHEGLRLAYTQARLPSIPEDAVRVVLLLSDGRATSGNTNSERISRLALDAFQSGVQTSALGLGTDYDGALMSSIAGDGAGGYYYLRDGDQIASALATELEKRLDPVATAVEVRVRLKKDVDLLRVYGSRRLSQAEAARVRAQEVAADAHAQVRDQIKQDRQDDSEGGMRFFIPAFSRGDSHALLLKLAAKPGAGSLGVASIEVKYKDRVSKKNVVEEIPVKVGYADSDAASAASMDPSVARTVQGFAAGEALSDAAARIARGDREAAIALLLEREDILTQAATALDEPLFLRDVRRLSRLRSFAGSPDGVGDPLVLSMLLETAGRSHLR